MLIGVKSHSREHPFLKRGRSIHAKNPLKVSKNFTIAFTIFRGSAYQCLLLIEKFIYRYKECLDFASKSNNLTDRFLFFLHFEAVLLKEMNKVIFAAVLSSAVLLI